MACPDARSDDEPPGLRASLRDATLRLEVWDSGTDGTVARQARRRDDVDASGGFGLELVARLSAAWGVERDTGGTTVWLELPTETAPTPW